MTVQQLELWNEKFMKAWEARDPDRVMSLFDNEQISYFESAVKPPITIWDQVYALWKVVPINQKDVKLTGEIVACGEKFGVIHWKLSRFFIPTKAIQQIDGIFVITLNKKGLCTYFNQWRTVA